METELTEAERLEMEATREVLRDVYGSAEENKGNSSEHAETILSTARKQLTEALQMLDSNERKEYDEAIKRCPHLVEAESCPGRFLRACGFDPWKAAQTIAKYWRFRVDVFGIERAYLPMNLTGNGAVAPDICGAMKRCSATLLLPPDGNNRPVLYCDRTRMCSRCADEDARLQILFYTVQTMFDSDFLALNNGYVIVTSMGDPVDDLHPTSDSPNRNIPRSKVLNFFKSGCIPLALKALHIVVFRKRSFLETSIPVWLKIVERWKFMSMRTLVHYAESRASAFGDLKQYGFLQQGLPVLLGGTLDVRAQAQQWFDSRLEVQQERLMNHPATEAAGTCRATLQVSEKTQEATDMTDRNELPSSSSLQHAQAAERNRTQAYAALEDLAEVADQARKKEAKARKRKMDAIYQMRKRQLKKSEQAKLIDELNLLRKDNFAFKQEQMRLESLLERAQLLGQAVDRIKEDGPMLLFENTPQATSQSPLCNQRDEANTKCPFQDFPLQTNNTLHSAREKQQEGHESSTTQSRASPPQPLLATEHEPNPLLLSIHRGRHNSPANASAGPVAASSVAVGGGQSSLLMERKALYQEQQQERYQQPSPVDGFPQQLQRDLFLLHQRDLLEQQQQQQLLQQQLLGQCVSNNTTVLERRINVEAGLHSLQEQGQQNQHRRHQQEGELQIAALQQHQQEKEFRELLIQQQLLQARTNGHVAAGNQLSPLVLANLLHEQQLRRQQSLGALEQLQLLFASREAW